MNAFGNLFLIKKFQRLNAKDGTFLDKLRERYQKDEQKEIVRNLAFSIFSHSLKEYLAKEFDIGLISYICKIVAL